MNFNLTTEQQLIADSVHRFIQSEYDFETRVATEKQGGAGLASQWTAFAANGWLAIGVPEDRGGFGGPVETALIAHELGRGLFLGPWLGSAVAATQVLLACGNKAIVEEWLPDLIEGSRRLALAYSEGLGAPDPVSTRANQAADGWTLTGAKTLVLSASGADALLVSATVEGVLRLFLVRIDAPGVTMTPSTLHDGSDAAEIAFDGAPALPLDAGTEAVHAGLDHAMLALSSELVGAMERAIEMTADYLHTRSQFGVTIGSFQSLQHRLADMLSETELARSMLYVMLAAFENETGAARRSVIGTGKAMIADLARSVCGQAIQLHGGIGMTEEYPIGHFFKRAVVAQGLFGGGALHIEAAARRLQDELA